MKGVLNGWNCLSSFGLKALGQHGAARVKEDLSSPESPSSSLSHL